MGRSERELVALPGLEETAGRRPNFRLSERDRALLRWIGEQYCVRVDLLGVLMARLSPVEVASGALVPRVVNRRVQAWRVAGLVKTNRILAVGRSTVWLTGEGMAVAGLPWRVYDPAWTTLDHHHAVGVVRAEAEARGASWVCERALREGEGGRPLHLPDGVAISLDLKGRHWRTAVEVELTPKTEARTRAILRRLLTQYDDVVYHATEDAARVVTRAARSVEGSDRVFVRPYPPGSNAALG